ncbi:MAG: acetylglutamate kinase [Alphaproteobacteria bacterium]|nr:acetylglutamate kinase [Alphaproteobacteria bacterium]MCD8526354.1 acetylglutamate kinase [Alphaproteobacteria bacterium]MCD8570206.1 acetylglutamate kinase [Alphaproteobacteria bacterium]
MTQKKKKARISNFFANAFYHSKFKDKLFVIKASGDLIEDDKALDSLMRNIKKLSFMGIKILFVYGGGKAVDKALEERGIAVQKQGGRRITDLPTLNVIKEVIGGRLSLRVYEAMANNGLEGFTFNAVPYEWMDVERRPKKDVDYGYVGDVKKVYSRPIGRMFRSSNFIAMPCLAATNDGQTLNINADTIATELAIGAGANKLVFLSNIDGVQIDGKTAFLITAEEIPGLIEKGVVTEGMKVKMENCLRALEGGVRRIHLINGLRENALEKEIFEAVGPGTMLMLDEERESYLNEIEIQKAIGGN